MSGKIRVWRTGGGTFFLNFDFIKNSYFNYHPIVTPTNCWRTFRWLAITTPGVQHQGYNASGTTPVVQHQGCTVV